MRSPLAALCAVAALVTPPIPAAHAQAAWQTCSFIGRAEACLVRSERGNTYTIPF